MMSISQLFAAIIEEQRKAVPDDINIELSPQALSKEDIANTIRKITNLPAPQDLVEFFSCYDCDMTDGDFYISIGPMQLMPFSHTVDAVVMWHKILESVPGSWDRNFWTLLEDGAGNSTVMDLTTGKIHDHDHETQETPPLADSLTDFLEEVLRQHRTGELVYGEDYATFVDADDV